MTDEVILMADPRVAAVPVRESEEELVDLRADGNFLIDPRKTDPQAAFAHLRLGVVERLALAEQDLATRGVRLLLVEGYRPPALQDRYFQDYSKELRTLHPTWSPERLRAQASRYVSPPELAPHSAGAVIDLTLADESGRELDLGRRVNASPEESHGRCYTAAAGLPVQARAHRTLLRNALAGAGLVNYPTEFWHWSFGDRYWALATGAPIALYGPASLASTVEAAAGEGR